MGGDGKIGNHPQIIGVERFRSGLAQLVTHCQFHRRICKNSRLHNAANGISKHAYRAYKAGIVHADAVDDGLAQRKLNGGFIGSAVNAGVFTVCGVINRSRRTAQRNACIGVIEPRCLRGSGSCRPCGFQFCVNPLIRDICQQSNSIHQFILLHIGFAERCIQPCAGCSADGFG